MFGFKSNLFACLIYNWLIVCWKKPQLHLGLCKWLIINNDNNSSN